MTPQKKALIVLAVLALIFILSMGVGVYMDRGERPGPDKETAKTYRSDPWATRLAVPISMFTPFLSAEALHYDPVPDDPGRFTIDSDTDQAFRSLTLIIESLSGKNNGTLQCACIYKNGASALEALKEQSDILSNRNSENTTTLVVLKEGGSLSLGLSRGCRVLMETKGDPLMICEKSQAGQLTVNPDFRP